MPKVGVVLSGCGFKDGAEIHESVFTLLYLDQAGAEIVCMAPNIEQRMVVNHLNGEQSSESRNVLVESARIARGEIKDIKDVDVKSLDAVIFPGGFGAALNLSNFGLGEADVVVDEAVDKFIKQAKEFKKPLGFICIAPAVAAKSIGDHVKLTIGNDKGTANRLAALGAVHENRAVDDIVVDHEHKVVSTPAYMLGPGPKDVAKGIEKLVKEVLKMV